MTTWEARVDGLTPDTIEMGTTGELNEEGMRFVEGCWVVNTWMEGVGSVAGAAWFIID